MASFGSDGSWRLWRCRIANVWYAIGTDRDSWSGMYAPRFTVDYTTGMYPILLGTGYTGGALYLVVYVFLAWRT